MIISNIQLGFLLTRGRSKLFQTFSWVSYLQGVGAGCPGRFILPPTQNFKENG